MDHINSSTTIYGKSSEGCMFFHGTYRSMLFSCKFSVLCNLTTVSSWGFFCCNVFHEMYLQYSWFSAQATPHMSSSASKIAEMNLRSWLTEQHMVKAGINDRPRMVTEQGMSERHRSTHSWPGSKLGPAPIRCCQTRPKVGTKPSSRWDTSSPG
jgi:hypothetical protein